MALLLAGILAGGCVPALTATPAAPTVPAFTATPEVVVVATRLTARFEGRLLERDGCYFAGQEDVTIAWAPEFTLERRGDILRVTGGWGRGEVWDLPVEKEIVAGGGWVTIPEERLAEFRVLPHCPKDQFFVFAGSIPMFQVTPEPEQ